MTLPPVLLMTAREDIQLLVAQMPYSPPRMTLEPEFVTEGSETYVPPTLIMTAVSSGAVTTIVLPPVLVSAPEANVTLPLIVLEPVLRIFVLPGSPSPAKTSPLMMPPASLVTSPLYCR